MKQLLLVLAALFGLAAPALAAPQVRMLYMVPSDRAVRADYATAMENAIEHFRIWLHQKMPEGRTITLHDPAVEILRTAHDAAWYATNPNGDAGLRFWNNCLLDGFALTGGGFNDPQNRWVFYIDADPACGQATGATQGVALLPANDLRGLVGEQNLPPCAGGTPDTLGPCRWVGGLGHELGHALLLPHPPGCEDANPATPCPSNALLWLGYQTYPSASLLTEDIASLELSSFLTVQEVNRPLFPCLELSDPPDRTPPVVECPDDMVVECSESEGAKVQFEVRATDDRSASPQVRCTPQSGSEFSVGTTTVNCTAIDDWGNPGGCSFTVRVTCGSIVAGDCNVDGSLDIADGICLLGFLFGGTPSRLPCGSGLASDPQNRLLLDANGDESLDLSDAIATFGFLFSGTAPPAYGTGCTVLPGCPERCSPSDSG
jgi:hypothetical protein